MNRGRALALLAGSGLFAGCATHAAPLLSLPNGTGRGTSTFPRRRPDGSLPPASAAGYRPAVVRAGTPAPRKDLANRICTDAGCAGPGGGGDPGSQPDSALYVGGLVGYFFSLQNYIETWTEDGSTLLDQWYWSVDKTLAHYAAQLGRTSSDVANAGGPTKPCDSCTTHTQSVAVTVSTSSGTFSATHDNGWSITGRADGTGNVALTAAVGSDVGSATVPYLPPNPSCWPVSLEACAAIAPIVLNAVATTSGCSASPLTCTAAGVLVGAMAAGNIDAVARWEAANC